MSPRKEAFLRGDKTYIGDPCKKCGHDIKYVSSYTCVACEKIKLANKELMAPYKTPEKTRTRLKNWRKNNPDKYKAQGQTPKSKATNCAKSSRYRAKRRNQTPENVDNVLIAEIYIICRMITETTGILHEVDHIIPISKGGLHHQDNLQILTASENRMKGNKT